jgi:hypothetical protein
MKERGVDVILRTFSILFLMISFALTLFLYTTVILDPGSTGELNKASFMIFTLISFIPWAILCWGLWELNNTARVISVIISMIFIGLLITIIFITGYAFVSLSGTQENTLQLQGSFYRAIKLFSLTTVYSSIILIIIYSLIVYFLGFNEEIKHLFIHRGKKLKTLFA